MMRTIVSALFVFAISWAADVHICPGVGHSMSGNYKEPTRWVGYQHGCPTPWGGISQNGFSQPVNSPEAVSHPTLFPVKRQAMPATASGGSPAFVAFLTTAYSGEDQKPLSIHDWYSIHYDFISMEDTIYTFETEFEMPEGYRRPDSADLTPFQNWVSHFPLWHRWKPVGVWKGGKAFERDQISRVVHLPWMGRNFRDYAVPLRILAEFLRYQLREFDLQVIPRLGDTLRYTEWLKGKPVYSGRGEVFFKPSRQREHNPYEYFQFLDLCMQNTSYLSLAENCDSIKEGEIAPGDLFIVHDEKGRTGFVYVILNMLINDAGGKLYVVATGCPEACDFHIPLVNEDRNYPWITIERTKSLGSNLPHAGFFRFKIK